MGTTLASMPDISQRLGYTNSTGQQNWPSEINPYYVQVGQWCDAAYEEARADAQASDEIRMVPKLIEYLMGKQWPLGRNPAKASPVNNRMLRLFWELVGQLTDMKPVYEVGSWDRSDECLQTAGVLNDLTKAWWVSSHADLKLAQGIIWSLLTTGFFKLEWNENKWNGRGDIELIPIGPDALLPLKPGTDLESAEVKIYHSVKPLRFFRNKYPTRGWLVQADPVYSQYETPGGPPANMSPMQYEALAPAMKRVIGRPSSSYISACPMAVYQEFWFDDESYNDSNKVVWMGDTSRNWSYPVQPGQKLYPRGRLIVRGGRVVLYDGPNPYWHGRAPFAMLRMNVVPWQFYGQSELKSWKDLQDIVNEILAGVLNMIKKALNPTIIAPRNAFSENTWQNLDFSLPNAKAAYSPLANSKPEFTRPPEVPAYVMNVYGTVCKDWDMQSGNAAMAAALDKKQIPGNDSLENLKNTRSVPVRLKGRYIENCLGDIGMMAVPNMFQFYDAARRYSLLGDKGILPGDLDGTTSMVQKGKDPLIEMSKYTFRIKPGTLLNIQRYDDAQRNIILRRMGDIDRQTMLDQFDGNYNVKQIEERLAKERAAMMGPMPTGRGGHNRMLK